MSLSWGMVLSVGVSWQTETVHSHHPSPHSHASSSTRDRHPTLCLAPSNPLSHLLSLEPFLQPFLSAVFDWHLTFQLIRVCLLSHFSRFPLFVTLWAVAHQAPLSMESLQARILEWVAMPSSRGSSQSRDWTWVSYVSRVGNLVLYHQCQLGSPLNWLKLYIKEGLSKSLVKILFSNFLSYQKDRTASRIRFYGSLNFLVECRKRETVLCAWTRNQWLLVSYIWKKASWFHVNVGVIT